MPKNIEIPFALQMGDTGASQNSRETLVNMYVELAPSGIKQIIRRQRPGLQSVTANVGEKRCIERHKGNHYIVSGPTLYRYNGITLTSIGTLASSTGRCTMIFNDNDQIMVSDGTVAYWYNGTILQTVSLPDGVTCGNLAYLSGYGIFNQPGTGKFYITGVNDFSAVDPLDFATAESSPDYLVRVFVDHNELWLAGINSTEVWQLTGGADFPFTAFGNAQLERGCGAAMSYAAEDNTVFFLGDDGIVYRADGYRPVRVSNTAVEEALLTATAGGKLAADALIYTWRGSKFYVLTIPGEMTLVHNISAGLWARAKTYNLPWWRVMGSAGHQSDYYLTPSGVCRLAAVNKDEGGILARGGISSPGYADGRRISVPEFFLDAEVGRAATGITPQVMLRVALDGETFGNEKWRTLGAIGKYLHRAMWRNLGQGRKPTLEIMVTDDFEFTVTTARAAVSVASS